VYLPPAPLPALLPPAVPPPVAPALGPSAVSLRAGAGVGLLPRVAPGFALAAQLGIAPLHYGVVLVIAMGIGLFAPPLGLGLYGACLIGDVPIEMTVKPMMKYLGLLFLCLLAIAFVPALSLFLPHALGY